MKRVKLTIAYDGTNYCGWQLQPNGITVEEVINRELSKLLQEDIRVIGASRTDSGVHALGNVAVFDTEARIPAEKISYALNRSLPEDIVVQSSEEVPLDFHPRYCDSRKTYEYRIWNAPFPLPTNRRYTYHVYQSLDIEAMKKGAGYLIGEHDFASFCSAGAQVQTTVRTIYNISILMSVSAGCTPQNAEELPSTDDITYDNSSERLLLNSELTLRICGNGFLYNMVRIITGTMLQVGIGAKPPEWVKEVLEAKDRNLAGPTAPAQGLTLVKIEYFP